MCEANKNHLLVQGSPLAQGSVLRERELTPNWKNIFFLFGLLCFGLGWSQTATLGDTTITMSGTHADLSALASISSGVTTTSSGDQTVYILDHAIKITGTVDHDPEKEKLIFSSTAAYATGDMNGQGHLVVANGGTYNYGVRKAGSDPRGDYSTGTGLVFLRSENAWTKQGLLVSGGTMNWRGGAVLTAVTAKFLSTTTIYDGMFINLSGPENTDDVSGGGSSTKEPPRFSIESSEVTVHKLTTDKAAQADKYGRIVIKHESEPTLSGIVQKGGYYQTEGNASFEDQALGANSSGRMNFPYHGTEGRYAKTVFLNNEKGSNYTFTGGVGSISNGGSYSEVKASVEVTAKDLNGDALQGAVIYAKDTNHNNRFSVDGNDYTSDKTYTLTTNNSGKASTEVLLSVHQSVKQSGTMQQKKDYRGDNNDATDLFTFHGFAYGYNSTQTQLELKGIGGVDSDIVFFEDRNISQTDKSIVDAYTEIETLDKLYDRAAAWKVDHVDDEYPSIDSPLIAVTGATLDLDSQNLVVDANASQAFAVNTSTNTITIKASALTVGNNTFSSITTTGNISIANGATIALGYEDTHGKNIYVDIDWGTNDAYDVKFTNLNDQTAITAPGTTTNVTQHYSGAIVAPNPFGSGIKIELYDTGTDDSTADRFYYTKNFTDANALTFSIDANEISADPTGAAQHEALFLARKILQKTESMASALDGTTPTLVDDTNTITEQSAVSATKENQEAIKTLLLRILTKTTATQEALRGGQ